MVNLREQLSNEIYGNNAYIEKIINWLKNSEKTEFNTNLFDLEVSEDKVYIYSCLNGNLDPDTLTIDEFYNFLLNCRIA
ncbi:hypothetical protein [Neisseria dumasiana]|uniref:hypothetical protein n=1 Tax=Neisseria dumasiana TaxID=1931275 RepID=UPI000A19B089|nr:hypothetical protein [Neisseria dumasiana]OSI13855.1 hypothetical protein BV914_11500 [Neisseria dumasiana]